MLCTELKKKKIKKDRFLLWQAFSGLICLYPFHFDDAQCLMSDASSIVATATIL